MASRQPVSRVNELVKALASNAGRANKSKGSFKARKSTFKVADTDMTVDSWKFADWDYKKKGLPTFARGLFTYRDPASENHQIVIRGYDKFFNINEIKQTQWGWIQDHTKPPYELTVKENGCIIFVSGMPDDTLLVCSKHSTGSRGDVEVSHAMAGERWIERMLANLSPPRTKRDLARALREANATAVAELCDDSFEEHILAYTENDAGLYLHGVNLNLPDFETFPMVDVHKFANEWGFRKIQYLVKNDVTSLRQFLEEAAETGSWDGKDVEGFVIRSKARDGPQDPNWNDWFFKYKFDEPYLMYRQWRECTKAIISGNPPKIRKHQNITKEYLQFARRYFVENPGASKQYQENHGIIKLRNAFLEEQGLKGSDVIKKQAEEEASTDMKFVIVPVATIGCGKTTVALGLVKLFGWGHRQNDNITAKKGKPTLFVKACAKELIDKSVVIADRNNHQRRERKQIFDDMGAQVENARFIALHYVHHSGNADKIRSATRERVFGRGDNHQTIRAGSDPKNVMSIMEGFISRFEPVDIDKNPDANFDVVIDLDPTLDSRENLEIVVNRLQEVYPKLIPELPSAEAYDEAIRAALEEYKPDIKHVIKSNESRNPKQLQRNQPQQKANPGKRIQYFCISLPRQEIISLLDRTFPRDSEDSSFINNLRTIDRFQSDFHVTLIHNADAKRYPEVWTRWSDLQASQAEVGGDESVLGTAEVRLKSVVWDDRIMALAADVLTPGVKSVNQIAHITIGTGSKDIKPKESNSMLEKWKAGNEAREIVFKEDIVLKGEIQAMLGPVLGPRRK